MSKKSAVVIGGGKSLGRYLSKDLASRGYKVAVVDIDYNNACQVAIEIGEAGGEAFPLAADATNEQAVVNMAEELKNQLPTIDLLVYNAGYAVSSKITDFKKGDFDKIVDINLNGYFLCSKYCSKIMIDNKTEGRIIQINSKSGKVGSKHNSGYSAAKFGAVGLTQSLALDLADHGITVNSLMLGNLLNSDMFESLLPQYAKKLNIPEKEVKQVYIDKVPLKRGCEFSDVANVLAFYASPEAEYCTGQSINITGGQVMF